MCQAYCTSESVSIGAAVRASYAAISSSWRSVSAISSRPSMMQWRSCSPSANEIERPSGVTISIVPRSTVSHHLKKLTDAGLLEREQRGKWAYFSINREAMARVAGLAELEG